MTSRGRRVLTGITAALLALDGIALAAPEELLVGVLSEQFTRKCLANGEETWVDPHEEVGFVRLLPGKGLGPTPARRGLRGKIVVAHGRSRPDYRAPAVKHEGRCPEAQMRSDMVWARGGARIRRGSSAPAAFEAHRIEAVSSLAVTLERGELRAYFRNTLGRELADLALTMHYEGCYGKPGATSETKRFARARPGEEMRATFPPLVSTARRAGMKGAAGTFRADHAASSLQITARAAGVYFDLDWTLTAPTAPRCPAR